MSDPINKRQGFRLDDRMKLRVKIPEPQEIEAIIADFDAFRMRYCLKSHLFGQTEMKLPLLQSIRKRSPEIAEYLEHLESQITHLATRLSEGSELEFDENHQEVPVNLSAVGLRFQTDKQVSVGQLIELGMVLSTSGSQLIVIAEVIRIEECPSEAGSEDLALNSVSTLFQYMHPDDTEAIIRHMAKIQLQQLQARRNS